MKKTILALAFLLLMIALIFTACSTKTVVPEDQALKAKGDSITQLCMRIDCTLVAGALTDNGPVQMVNTIPPDEVVKGKEDSTKINIDPLYRRILNLIKAYKALEKENSQLKARQVPVTVKQTNPARHRH